MFSPKYSKTISHRFTSAILSKYRIILKTAPTRSSIVHYSNSNICKRYSKVQSGRTCSLVKKYIESTITLPLASIKPLFPTNEITLISSGSPKSNWKISAAASKHISKFHKKRKWGGDSFYAIKAITILWCITNTTIQI